MAHWGVSKADVREDGRCTSPACLLELSAQESPTDAASSELPLDDLSIRIDLPGTRLDPNVVAREPMGTAGDPCASDESAFLLCDQPDVSARQSQPHELGINQTREGGRILRDGKPHLDSGRVGKSWLLSRPLHEGEPLERYRRTPGALDSPEGEGQCACSPFPFAAFEQAAERVMCSCKQSPGSHS
jgi:hypothetical protein